MNPSEDNNVYEPLLNNEKFNNVEHPRKRIISVVNVKKLYYNLPHTLRYILGSIIPSETNYNLFFKGSFIVLSYSDKYEPTIFQLNNIIKAHLIDTGKISNIILYDKLIDLYDLLIKAQSKDELCICCNNKKDNSKVNVNCSKCDSLTCKECYDDFNHYCKICSSEFIYPKTTFEKAKEYTFFGVTLTLGLIISPIFIGVDIYNKINPSSDDTAIIIENILKKQIPINLDESIRFVNYYLSNIKNN